MARNNSGPRANASAASSSQRGHIASGERNFAAPRLTELKEAGSVVATGKKICGKTGRNVTVWAAKGAANGHH
jgi:hypothetical protein